ncbi:MAG TPA: RNA polymerase sigma-54 factor, partial [Gemmatimonadetes bacterium]|nr:RNA polymerase sigma-54 factor [Gemmatimonadota bacterium]
QYRIVDEHFEQLVNRHITEIAKTIGVKPIEVQDVVDSISQLDPKQGLKYSTAPEEYVIPDLIVEFIDGEYMVFANDTSLPRLRISQAYREVAKDKKEFTGENREFIANKLNSANWMIQAIEQRRQTMLKVMTFIVGRQREFFEKGVQHLKPLTLREVADHIEMHESTVSRVTNKKFVQTPRGVYSLKYFFSTGLSTTSGDDISARGVRDKIRTLVADEDRKKPLTDQALVNLLKEDGVKIARRTVAKYRDQLDILPARMRKRV